MTKKLLLPILIALLILPNVLAQPIHKDMDASEIKKQRAIISSVLGSYPEMFLEWRNQSERKVKLTNISIIPARTRIELDFNSPLAQIGIREQLVLNWEQMIRDTLSAKTGQDYSATQIAIYSDGVAIEKFVPNAYRKKFRRDESRTAKPSASTPLTRIAERPVFGGGLELRHIALWPSHGYYYSQKDSVWQFQRPALFSTIEDLHTFEYCHAYLIPMLENAGAVVISPRERSPQRTEIIVDNDLSHSGCKITQLSGKWSKNRGGFLRRDSLHQENLFTLGTHLAAETPASIEYRATLQAEGIYGITVSYRTTEKSNSRVIYRIAHKGGTTDVEVNQQMMGGTWVYLGEFDLSTTPTVTIIADGKGIVTTDAVRFGGGMGSVVRGGVKSSLPRWAEAARYSMQYSGVPKEIYAIGALEIEKDPKRKADDPLEDDYADDYKSRGTWVNWIRSVGRVPVDMAISLHTNAGVNDTIFGSMTIHHSNAGKDNFSNGKNRFASRDLADLVLTQIVGDMCALHTKKWTRRSIYDKRYSEAFRPDVPSTIVEMFSHQDPLDMSYALQPQVRFDMARAIYKGILKFLADRYNTKYTVQPLPINTLKMSVANDSTLRLSWKPTNDALEPTAKPSQYKLYTRMGENSSFNSGVVVSNTYIEMPIARDSVIRSYRITALNNGGESFASEVVSCGFVEGTTAIEAVDNTFDPKANKALQKCDLSYVGQVYDRDPKSEFIDNANPGHGASKTNRVARGRMVDSRDNTVARGAALLRSGHSYITQ